jgi:hypothetical protein
VIASLSKLYLHLHAVVEANDTVVAGIRLDLTLYLHVNPCARDGTAFTTAHLMFMNVSHVDDCLTCSHLPPSKGTAEDSLAAWGCWKHSYRTQSPARSSLAAIRLLQGLATPLNNRHEKFSLTWQHEYLVQSSFSASLRR